jgi:hypothetical protein
MRQLTVESDACSGLCCVSTLRSLSQCDACYWQVSQPHVSGMFCRTRATVVRTSVADHIDAQAPFLHF